MLPLVLRQLAKPTTIAGHDLPAGVKDAPSIIMIVTPGTYTWIPFGGGVRRCLGAAFALFELQVVLEAVVRKARPRAPRPQTERVMRRAITLAPAGQATVVREPVPV